VIGYKRFKGPCCLHLQVEVTDDRGKWHRYRPGVQEDRWKKAWTSEMFVATIMHGVTTQKTST